MRTNNKSAWPFFSYEQFKTTSHLLHMLMQVMGKLKLLTPFEPEWSNVGLYVTDQGITTGLIPYKNLAFAVSVNFLNHTVILSTTEGNISSFKLESCSVAELFANLMSHLYAFDIDVTINPKPQEVPNPILFNEDIEPRIYDSEIVQAWWQILVNSQKVMQHYHALFLGKTPPIALMWGTLDLRDVRFNGKRVTPTGVNSGYLRRNAMDEEQVETGWWGGNELYPHAAYYSFTYPQPENIEQAEVEPKEAIWNPTLAEFILHYDDVYKSKNPNETLLSFLESTYNKGSSLAHWNTNLVGEGHPI